MTIAIVRDPIYRGRRFQSEIIELCVRWYLTYRMSYRDLVEMLAERGVVVSHTTIYRWVQQYVPEFDRRWSRYAKAVHPSWRVDETAISVRGGHRYLYRAVDKFGKTVDSRGAEADVIASWLANAAQGVRWSLPYGGRLVESHFPDVPPRGFAEQTRVLTAELRRALVSHTTPCVSGVKILVEHQLSRFLQA